MNLVRKNVEAMENYNLERKYRNKNARVEIHIEWKHTKLYILMLIVDNSMQKYYVMGLCMVSLHVNW